MTRRKDPLPESLQPETLATDPAQTEADPVVAPFVEPPAAEAATGPEPLPAPPLPPPPPRSGLLGALLGGAIAAVAGFAVSHFNFLGLTAPDTSAVLAPLTARIDDAQAKQAATLDQTGKTIAALADRVAALESTPAPIPPDLSRLDALDQRLAAIEAIPAEGGASTAALTAKITDLEQRLASLPASGADPVLQQKLDEALARLTEAEAAATRQAVEAETTATAARRAMALDALTDAVASGQPFQGELAALADPVLTSALGAQAETGAPTLARLQAGFPDQARAALQIAREISTEDGWGTRLVEFLAAQTGARSLTPREGSDADAILSRAEFALSEGRVADALAELTPLDPAISAPLAPWMTEAKAHLAAVAALNTARGK